MDLHFRAILEEDLQMIMNWRTMPQVSAYMYTDFEPDIDMQRQWFASISADDRRFDWIITVDGEDVGMVSIVRIDQVNNRAEWAYYLASPSVRGKGIGRSVEMNILKYVFEDLGLHKLCCEVFASNELVVKIHEKYGSSIEGTRREQIFKNDEYHDIVEMGILREDWKREIQGRIDFVPARID
jgi:UDP-4-amino-4,6-dideoxy-N-acetyl-beta-L-altrosamine N-acetyltransferase